MKIVKCFVRAAKDFSARGTIGLLVVAPTFAFAGTTQTQFISRTAHLDFWAPKTCQIEVESQGKTADGAYKLLGRSCKLVKPKLPAKLAKKVEHLICTMLVPALNTPGQDIFGNCKDKKFKGHVVTAVGCGPKKNLQAKLNLKTLVLNLSTEENPDQKFVYTYSMIKKKLYPKSISLKSELNEQKIKNIKYVDDFPSSLEAEDSDAKMKITFSECQRKKMD